jgi:hypothetical protein
MTKTASDRPSVFAQMRRKVRERFFSTLRRALETDDGRDILDATLGSLLSRPRISALPPIRDAPYPELRADEAPSSEREAQAVFLTGRFRAGTTTLWNIFRNTPGMTAYYEPFNERRWFDSAARGDRVDTTHRRVHDYWAEYEGFTDLGALYDPRWTSSHLHMDAQAWNPAMERYVRSLIERAPGRPILKFNRIDFRLPWFRCTFPNATFIHIYRHPRDQWCSTLLDLRSCPPDARLGESPWRDHFYLLVWARDLRHFFPFLDESVVEHPYELFYLMWRLSFLFGRTYCHHSIEFEKLVTDPVTEIRTLFQLLRIRWENSGKLTSLIEPPQIGRWREYADDQWFRAYEKRCERILARYLRAERLG